jgi:tRNA-specific 2-thiouridylase
MRNWDSTINNDYLGNPNLNNNICPQEQDYNDALEVCNKLGIPLHRVDYVKEYWDNVFTYFLDELKKGRTPNPDVMCNKYIKFDLFYKKAKELGADYIATGHYAKIRDGKLCKASDLNKDQSYFLAYVNKEVFKDVLFPLQDITKPEVRKIAEEYGLVTAKKKDSTGICFIGERNLTNFLKNYLPNKPGDVVNIDTNEVIGKHIGLMYYTIGQRRGLNIGGTAERMFVVGKDLTKNILYICIGEDNEYLITDSCIIDEVNYLGEKRVTKCTAKFRYRQKDVPVELEYLDNNEILVKYPQGVKRVTPGQVCVLYDGEECLGGGIIKEVRKNGEKLWYL